MSEDDEHALRGTLTGLRYALGSVMMAMEPSQAAKAQEELASLLASTRDMDVDDEGPINPAAEVKARDDVTESFIKILGLTANPY
jgi:hypothetical protein